MEQSEKRKVIAIIVFVALFVGLSIFWQDRQRQPAKVLAETPATVAEALARQKVTIDVSGAVAKAGVYFVTPDSRVNDAIEAAGGFLPEADIDKVNLARRCKDGMKITVPFKKATVVKTKRTSQPKAVANIVVNINAANEEELLSLPGVGPALAKKIIEYRQQNGVFKVAEQLLDVNGIGESKYEQMKEYVEL